jgi:AcrR family transcriptional regulator
MAELTMSDDLLILTNGREAPSRADAVQNRADILQSARSLFAEHGVEDVSMSQIARAADVGKGTLYRHFRSKAELCIALLDSEQRALQERTFTHLRNSRQTPLDNLTWFIREVAAFTENNMELLAETSIENQIDLDHPAHHWQWMTIVGLLRLANAQGDLESPIRFMRCWMRGCIVFTGWRAAIRLNVSPMVWSIRRVA